MIFAVSVPASRELVIAAADSVDEQQSFIRRMEENFPTLIQDTDFGRFFTDPDLSKFPSMPTILEFPTGEELETFVRAEQITLMNFPNAHDKQKQMFALDVVNDNTGRTLGEIHGLMEHDPWDGRTPEEKAAADEAAKKAKAKRKDEGDLTGDSFGGGLGGDDGGLQIRDVRITVDDDGNIEVGNVLADKDLFRPDLYRVKINDNTDLKRMMKRSGLLDTDGDYLPEVKEEDDGSYLILLGMSAANRLENSLIDSKTDHEFTKIEREVEGADGDYLIAEDDMVAIYFRVDVKDASMAQISAITEAADLRPAFKSRDVGPDCWAAYVREASAQSALLAITNAGFIADIAEVDPRGMRIIEEGAGATVIDSGAADVEPPLPWNEGRDEFFAMDEGEQKKALAGRWLLYSIRDYGNEHGRIIHITPRSYFNENGKLWEGELPIEHLLPNNLHKFGDKVGVYQCKSLDLNTADFMLGNRAMMKESLMLRMHLNELGANAT